MDSFYISVQECAGFSFNTDFTLTRGGKTNSFPNMMQDWRDMSKKTIVMDFQGGDCKYFANAKTARILRMQNTSQCAIYNLQMKLMNIKSDDQETRKLTINL